MAFWAPYVPVAKRRANARREMNRLQKKGRDIQPISIEGRTIARSFWGKGWCEHLESFSDFANRLPRGRTYVRNGSVCHLEVRPGHIEAIVSGSELYNVTVRINPLKAATWKAIKTQCAGQIGSVLELLQGKLSDHVMGVVTHRTNGLFPKPGEIKFDCSCPDWAIMCKHVAAVLYGVGSRLDNRPELLFFLRDVDAAELIAAEMALPTHASTSDTLGDDELSDIFGIDLDTEEVTPSAPKAPRKKSVKSQKSPRQRATSAAKRQDAPAAKSPRATPSKQPTGRGSKATAKSARQLKAPRTATPAARASARDAKAAPSTFRPTGKSVARLRHKCGLSVAEFAEQLGVSTSTVYRWELAPGKLNLQEQALNALEHLHQQARA